MGFFENIGTVFDYFINGEEYSDAGKTGERFTYRKLKDKFPTNQIFRNVYLKRPDGTYTEIDLIAVGFRGIYVFESKNYSGWIFGDEAQRNWTQSMQNGAKTKFYNPIMQNKTHINCLKHNLAQFPNIKYYSFIVFSERCELKKISCSEENTYVLKRDSLNATLDKVFNANPTIISKGEMAEITELLKNAQRPDAAIKEQHLEDVQNILTHCPRCKGELVKRTNKETGNIFFGCVNFPKCRFITKDAPITTSEEATLTEADTPAITPEEPTEPIQDASATEPAAICPRCKSEIVKRSNRKTGEAFYGCSGYPKCRYIIKGASITTGADAAPTEVDTPLIALEEPTEPTQDDSAKEPAAICPRCKSELVKRTNRKTGEVFYGCSGFPKCRYIAKENTNAEEQPPGDTEP